MNKALLGLILGFFLHKGLEEVYDYHFEKGFVACGPQYMLDIEAKVDAPLTKRFQCTYKEMGLVSDLKYILMRPHYTRNENNGKWYY